MTPCLIMHWRINSDVSILTAFIAADALSISSATAGLVMWPLHHDLGRFPYCCKKASYV